MSTARKLQLGFMLALWLLLCYLMIASQPFTLRVLLLIICSGIVVWVPIYKKYYKNGKGNES